MRIVHCGHCALPPVGANCSQLTLQLTHTHILGAPQVKNQLSNYLVFSTNIILRQALKYILILCSLLRCYCVKNLHGKYLYFITRNCVVFKIIVCEHNVSVF